MDSDNLGFYDLIIDIESFNDLKENGWKIEKSQDGSDKYEFFKEENTGESKEKSQNSKKKLNRIGVLGVSGVGKTFILKKLIGKNDDDNQNKTKGISVIYPKKDSDNLFACIDSQGSEEPIIDKSKTKEEVFDLNDSQRKDLIKKLSKDKKFTEIFIQDFIIRKSNILIVVVDQLTFSEQKLINRLKYNKNYDKLFVIHNTQFFEDKETIKAHIENVVKKSIFSNLEKGYIIFDINSNDDKSDKSDKSDKPFYYKEKEIGKQKKGNPQQEIIHLFMAKEGSEAGNYFNKITIDFIRNKIKTETRPIIFDVIKEVKSFLSECSIQYMIKEVNKDRPITVDEIEIDDKTDNTYLICKNKNFELKNYVMDEMGMGNFTTENSINPSYVCYKGEYKKSPYLIVQAEMFVNSKIDVKQQISDDNQTMNISISCEKKFEKDPNIIEEYGNIEGSDIKPGIMTINIKFNLYNFTIDSSKKPLIDDRTPGIYVFYFKINDKNEKDNEAIDDIKKKENKEKKKEKKNK